MREGSFNWYLTRSGDFVKLIARAIQHADPRNRERLRRAYPQMVAAFEYSTWDLPPVGFDPVYDAEAR